LLFGLRVNLPPFRLSSPSAQHRSFPLYWCINNFCALIELLCLCVCAKICVCVCVTCISQINWSLVSHSILEKKASSNFAPFAFARVYLFTHFPLFFSFLFFFLYYFFFLALLFTYNTSHWRPNEGLISKHIHIHTNPHTHIQSHFLEAISGDAIFIPRLYVAYVPLIPLLISLFGTFCVIDWLTDCIIQLAKLVD